ncbi:mitochondrial carrier [Neoconidiobolus thromboides FSU 785]|nr:mitochondrial carrier [Neoconidiobolus thromboides FSU 785]
MGASIISMNQNKDQNNKADLILEKDYNKKLNDLIYKHRTGIAAGSSGITSVLVGHPFDTLKTRMQVADPPLSLSQCYKDIVGRYGYLSLWRGVAGPLCVVSLLKGFSFTSYDMASRTLMHKFYDVNASSMFNSKLNKEWFDLPHYSKYNDTPFYKKLPLLMASGAFAGTLTVMLSGPLELIKVQVQLGRRQTSIPGSGDAIIKKKSEGIISCAKRIYNTAGVTGFYRGVLAHLYRDGFGTAIYFGGYESFKTLINQSGLFSFGLTSLVSGGLAGTLSWCVLFPIDVVKSRLQKEAFLPKQHQKFDGSIIKCIKLLYRTNNNFKVFYAGLPPTLLRALPIHALNFTIYENVMKWIEDTHQ